MGSQDSKIDTTKVPLGQIMASSPPQVNKFSPPFRKFHHQYQKENGNQIQIILSIQEPYRGNITITQQVFNDLQQAFEVKTKNIQIDSVLFDDQYIDHCTYLIKDGARNNTMQLRPFSNFNTHNYNNIVCQVDILQEITKLKCPNLNSLVDSYVIQTGLETEGEDFPNTQIIILEPIATNLSEIIRYRRENKWQWTVGEFNSLAKDLTQALSTLHDAGISHNDIRPCNIYYSLQKGCYQLGSYANSLKSGTGESIIGIRSSTFFGAPELDNSAERNLIQADIYSLGMTLLCAFYLCQPISRKGSSPYNRKYEQKYEIMTTIREMIMPVEKRKTLSSIMKGIKEGTSEKKMKSMIQSLKYKNSPKQIKLIKTKKALSDVYQRLGLWNQWKDTVTDTFQLEQHTLDESKKAAALAELSKIQSCRGQAGNSSQLAKRSSKMYRNLGDTAFQNGNINQAIGHYGKAIDCSKYFQNQNDLEVARNLQGLALSHAEKGDYEVSKPLIREASFIVGKTESKQSLEFCKMKMSEARIETDFGQFQESDKVLMECLGIAEKKIFEHEEVGNKLKAQVLQQIGRNSMLHSTYNERQKNELLRRAEKYVGESLSLNEKYPDNHIPLSINVETFGQIEMKRQSFKDARNNFKKADYMRDAYLKQKKKEGSMDKEKAQTFCNIAFCDTSLGEHNYALENYEKSLKIYRGLYGSNHNKYSAIAIGKMSRVYFNMGEKGKAKQCLRLASQILEQSHGKQDPDYEYFKRIEESI